MEMKATGGYHGSGEADHNHGKKSVLKKVKEKAKKLKDCAIGKKKHQEGEVGPHHEGEVREHGLPLDYMEEEEEVDEEIELVDEEGNFLGAEPGKVREKMGQSEPSVAITPGIYKPPEPQLAGGSVMGIMGLKDVVNWPMIGATEVLLSASESRQLDEGPGAKRSESHPLDENPGTKRSEFPPLDGGSRAKRSETGPCPTPNEPEKEDEVPEPRRGAAGDRPFDENPDGKMSEPAVMSPDISEAKDAIASMVHPKRDDEGVSAAKYVMEKLSPGEEERALSEVIKDAIQATTKFGDRDDDEAGEKVSEAAAGGNRRGMVEKVKEVAISLVGKDRPHGGGHQASDLGGGRKSADGRELQESTI